MLFIIWNVFQGRNVDAMIIYFGEDPSRCPFEQGIITYDHCVMQLQIWILLISDVPKT